MSRSEMRWHRQTIMARAARGSLRRSLIQIRIVLKKVLDPDQPRALRVPAAALNPAARGVRVQRRPASALPWPAVRALAPPTSARSPYDDRPSDPLDQRPGPGPVRSHASHVGAAVRPSVGLRQRDADARGARAL